MDNNDMSEMIKKAKEMINNNQIPDDLKKMVANFQNQNNAHSLQNNNYRANNNNDNNTQKNGNNNLGQNTNYQPNNSNNHNSNNARNRPN